NSISASSVVLQLYQPPLLVGFVMNLYLYFLISVINCVSAWGMDKLEFQMAKKTIPAKKGRFLDLHLGIYIESISNFRTQEMVFDVDLYLYTSWRDPRMRHNSSDEIVLIADKETRDKIWLPDLYFANARFCNFQEVTVPNFNLFVDRNGVISYSLRATCSISCSLDLVNYPMDRQQCAVRVISYAHTREQMRVRWFSESPLRMNEEIELPEFSITKIQPDYCDNSVYRYAITEKSYRTGNFSCLEASLFLERSLGYNLVQSYIPTGLIVAISWVSFFIDRRAVPARVTLSFTTLVSLTTLGNGLRYDLPQVSYAKAIDLWYGACLIFVFLALIEFAVVNSFMRTSEKFATISTRQTTRRPALHARSILREDTPEKIFTESPEKRIGKLDFCMSKRSCSTVTKAHIRSGSLIQSFTMSRQYRSISRECLLKLHAALFESTN
ncbi:hypothetical protein PRIPAC_82655, partial [Pristionchus pacificus]